MRFLMRLFYVAISFLRIFCVFFSFSIHAIPECLRTFEWQIRDHLAHHVFFNPTKALKTWLYLKIRKPRLSDERALFRINGRSFYFETYKNVFPRSYLSLRYQEYLRYYRDGLTLFSQPSEGFYLIATYGNKPVGYIHLGEMRYNTDDPLTLCAPSEVLAMYVCEAYRSIGIGEALLRAGLSYFHAKGQMPTVVCARTSNQGAQIFYQRQGACWVQDVLCKIEGLYFVQKVYLFDRFPQPFVEKPSWLQEKGMVT